MKRLVFAAILLLTITLIVVNVLHRRPPQLPDQTAGVPRPKVQTVRQPTARIVAIQAEGETNAPTPIQLKMDRLYSTYFANPNPGYRNILDMLGPLALYDPTTTDLYKDACTFVSLRTELANQQREYATHRAEMVKWVLTHAPKDPQSQSNALEKFEHDAPPRDIQELQKADAAIQRVFQDRFTRHHGLNGDAVVTQLSLLTLTNAGPELWIRCDENASPYPEPPQPVFNVKTRE